MRDEWRLVSVESEPQLEYIECSRTGTGAQIRRWVFENTSLNALVTKMKIERNYTYWIYGHKKAQFEMTHRRIYLFWENAAQERHISMAFQKHHYRKNNPSEQENQQRQMKCWLNATFVALVQLIHSFAPFPVDILEKITDDEPQSLKDQLVHLPATKCYDLLSLSLFAVQRALPQYSNEALNALPSDLQEKLKIRPK